MVANPRAAVVGFRANCRLTRKFATRILQTTMMIEPRHPLAVWREVSNKQQAALASELGVKRWTIFAIETGLRKPSPELAKKIEAVTGIPRGDLRPDLWGSAA